MPYFDDEENKNQQQQQDPSKVQISGASPTTNSEGTVDQQPANSKAANTGSGYQNLDKYLNTNQAQDFGKQFYGKVQGEVDTAAKNQDTVAQQFKDQVKGAGIVPTSDQVNSAIANPTGANAQDFQKWENQKYTGPNSLADNQSLSNQFWSGTTKANTSAKLSGTEPGRFSLLDSYYGRPTYNFGEKSLDNLLVQQSGLGSEQKGIQNQAAQLQSRGTDIGKDLQTAAAQQAAAVDQSRAGVRSAIGIDAQGNVITGAGAGAIGKEYSGVEAELAQQNAARQAQIAKVQGDISSGNLTADELAQFGLDPNQKLFTTQLSDYFTPDTAGLNKNNVMTPEQRARIQALSQLAGVTDTYASGASQAIANPYAFNTNKLATDTAAIAADYATKQQTTPVVVGSNSGQTNTYSMAELNRQIQATYADIARGNDTNAGRAFLKFAEPALAKAQNDLDAQYQARRTIGAPVAAALPDVAMPTMGNPAALNAATTLMGILQRR